MTPGKGPCSCLSRCAELKPLTWVENLRATSTWVAFCTCVNSFSMYPFAFTSKTCIRGAGQGHTGSVGAGRCNMGMKAAATARRRNKCPAGRLTSAWHNLHVLVTDVKT